MSDGQAWPRVSIVTPSYNQGRFIEETIRSVLLQGYPDLEYIIIDGGSTDGAVDIIKKYQQWLTCWVSEPDKGQSDAINKGWSMATGEIYAWLNSDDTYMPAALETVAGYLAANPDCGMIYGGCAVSDESSAIVVDNTVRVKAFDLRALLFGRNAVPQPAVFLRSRVLDSVGYLDPALHFSMDHDLWVRIGLEFEVGYADNVLSCFRICPGTKTTSHDYRVSDERFRILDKTFSRPELRKEVRAIRRRAYGSAHRLIGLRHYADGDFAQARRHLVKSAAWYPAGLADTSSVAYLVASLLGRRLGGTLLRVAVRCKARLKRKS